MYKLSTLMLSCILCFNLNAQSEPFVKALKTLPYGSTILDGAMLFAEHFPEFKRLTVAPVYLGEQVNPKDENDTIVFEAFYLINEKDRELIQLYYANDKLYEKAVYWFFDPKEVSEVEIKYKKCHNTFISSHALLQAESGVVKSNEEEYDLGRKTSYPIKKIGKQEHYGESGYHLVYNRQVGERGFWVYAQLFNTLDTEMTDDMEIPHVSPPDATFDEVPYMLTSAK